MINQTRMSIGAVKRPRTKRDDGKRIFYTASLI
ncbi:Uncharacterised protein [Zhongshania aliphaticivorans]|uniref:Uncharacterized protein n=1 Tax=Zhongshania aliphaticivorans TaxID=1470434 RepID=A0A5S9NC87_9GAMM|nr:Uncharacterised protein [Zhongshania aliphaticivorans]CAA0113822.1 Uncharacterised protein [Zhongshania aliphaticivorans]